jgi:hypothetical protein
VDLRWLRPSSCILAEVVGSRPGSASSLVLGSILATSPELSEKWIWGWCLLTSGEIETLEEYALRLAPMGTKNGAGGALADGIGQGASAFGRRYSPEGLTVVSWRGI